LRSCFVFPERHAVGLRIALGQLEARVGDVAGNVEEILDAWTRAAEAGADLVVFTELATTGYPPEDLLLKPEFVRANLDAIDELARRGPAGTVALVGYVGCRDEDETDATDAEHWDVALASRDLRNSAAVLADGEVIATYDKLRLPNYGVFDEARYFTPGDQPCVVEVAGVAVGVTICEDLWSERGPVQAAAQAGAQVIASLNASPYHRGKRPDRERWVTEHTARHGVWLAWVNCVGGHDDVVFDGDSMLGGPDGRIVARGAQFDGDLVLHDLDVEPADIDAPTARAPGAGGDRPPLGEREDAERLDEVEEVYTALVRATRDYCHRNGFDDAVIGLSGGIDSALTFAVAVDALGADHVTGVAMPSAWSTDHSKDDAEAQAEAMGARYLVLPIGEPLDAVGHVLEGLVATDFDDGAGVAYENLQSRLRGLLLMALSNEHGSIVLTTGNKSEYAVGYATIYGDMAGGFAPLKDVPKLLVYELSRWRNREGEVIPSSVIDKPPSAELRPDQKDEDSLPPYEVLDDIIEAYVVDDEGIEQIVARGHDEATVREILRKVDGAEFKRRQAAPGPKITERAFGRDRRVPITNLWSG
jgi:NAD+ synthase (glutamine-hydrolysing)